MDINELQFLDTSFSYATAFSTFMYIPEAEFQSVLSEVWRVLKPEGGLMIWEPIFVVPPEERSKKLALIPLAIQFPDLPVIDTGNGGILRDQDSHTIIEPAEKTGFKVLERRLALALSS